MLILRLGARLDSFANPFSLPIEAASHYRNHLAGVWQVGEACSLSLDAAAFLIQNEEFVK